MESEHTSSQEAKETSSQEAKEVPRKSLWSYCFIVGLFFVCLVFVWNVLQWDYSQCTFTDPEQEQRFEKAKLDFHIASTDTVSKFLLLTNMCLDGFIFLGEWIRWIFTFLV